MKCKYLVFLCALMPDIALAMADRTPPVYGVPALYGEYEISSDDVRRARAMYGDVPRARPMAAPVAADAATIKQPVRTKKIVSKKAAKKKRARAAVQKNTGATKATKSVTMSEITPLVASVAPVVADVVPVTVPVAPAVVIAPPRPAPQASDIAGAVSNRIEVDSYCTTRGAAPGKNMPDGFVLMPGRPDLMSCRDK